MMKGLCPGSIRLPTQFNPSFLFSETPSIQGHAYMHEQKSKASQTCRVPQQLWDNRCQEIQLELKFN